MTLSPAPEERISAAAPAPAGSARLGWALCSLLFHGTALAAVLIAAAGAGPQLPPPTIEVSIVAAPVPPGAAATAAQKGPEAPEAAPVREPVEAEPDPATELASIEHSEPPAAESEPTRSEPRPEPVLVSEAAPAPEKAPPPPPARKPEPPEPAPQEPAASDASPAPAPIAGAQPAQLAALPDAESVDSAAPPGAGMTRPPRYEAGGEANPWPRYPAAARRRGIEGEVLVRVAVGLDGRAERVEVLRSSGSALLDKSAVEALERWRFEPARAAGRPVAATVEIPVIFRLTDPEGS
jgi:protein TonB